MEFRPINVKTLPIYVPWDEITFRNVTMELNMFEYEFCPRCGTDMDMAAINNNGEVYTCLSCNQDFQTILVLVPVRRVG